MPGLSAASVWITSRAAGTAALVLSSISVCVGLTMVGRMLKGRGPDLRVTHEALSLATLAALAVHGLTLIGDGFLHLSLADVAVPFLGPVAPLPDVRAALGAEIADRIGLGLRWSTARREAVREAVRRG